MNKKLLLLVGIVALEIGAIGAIALQSHAQTTNANALAVTTASSEENSVNDTDNIQDDEKGIEKSNSAVLQDTGEEIDDDQEATSEIKQNDTQEHNESNAVDFNEVEDSD